MVLERGGVCQGFRVKKDQRALARQHMYILCPWFFFFFFRYFQPFTENGKLVYELNLVRREVGGGCIYHTVKRMRVASTYSNLKEGKVGRERGKGGLEKRDLRIWEEREKEGAGYAMIR